MNIEEYDKEVEQLEKLFNFTIGANLENSDIAINYKLFSVAKYLLDLYARKKINKDEYSYRVSNLINCKL